MFRTFLIAALLLCCYADKDDIFHSIKCKNIKVSNGGLPPGIKLQGNYATTVRYTNWDTNQAALIIEKKFDDVMYAQKVDRNQTQTFVIGKDSTITFNENSCTNSPKFSPELYPVHDLIKTGVLKDAFGIGAIVDAIMNTNFFYQSIVDTAVIGGIDSAAWVGCNFNVTNTTGIQVAVFFADKGPHPYSKAYSNPVALSIHFSTFEEFNNTYTVKNHSSVDITGLELVNMAEKDEFVTPPRGQFCENMTMIALPLSIPDRFGATIDFVNTKTKQVDNIEIMYDSILKVTHYALDLENDLDIPFVAGLNGTKGRASIYRDFNYGIQYVTSKDGRICTEVKALDAKFGDCTTVDGKVQMVSAENILLNITNAKFYKYGNLVIEGVAVESYLSKGDQSVVEVNFVSADWNIEGVKGQQLHSIVHYHKEKDMKTVIHFESFRNYSAIGPLWLKTNIFPCSTDFVDDSFFYVNFQNVTLKEIQAYGTENVECALAESISEVANVSVFRISYFMFKEAGKSVIAMFLLSNKANVAPTQTAYLKNELNVTEFKEALNRTILSTGFVTKLITEDQKPAAININRLGVINTSDEHIPGPTYIGYSGGSMFILGVFSFIFGAAIAVGVYVFYTKRRTISGMTYQVFE